MGGRTANKNWMHPHCIIATATTNSNNDTNNELNMYSCKNTLTSIVSAPTADASMQHAILDSGATDHYLQYNPNPKGPPSQQYKPITVTLPNGTTSRPTQECTLPVPNMDT